jgi:putative membrane protein
MTGGVPSIPELFVSHWAVSAVPTALAVVSAGLYLVATARVTGGWPLRRTLAFLAGIGTVLVAIESGIGSLDDELLSVHMVQHMLLLMVAPLLLLAGQPAMLMMRTLPPARRPRVAHVLARAARWFGPLQALTIYTVVLLGTHLPAFYDATLTHPALHDAEHVLYLSAGLVLWWPILDADPAPHRRLGGLARLGYMLAAMPSMALIGAYLNRHATVVYSGYAAPAHVLGISAVNDQATAGAIMWVAGNTIMVLVGLWAVMASLVAEERRQQSRDARAAATEGMR